MKTFNNNSICYFAQSNFRLERQTFGIRLKDRLHHFYILGKTGTGKTTLLETKIINDIQSGFGICLIDIHGDLVKRVLKDIPENRTKDVVYLDATNPNLQLGYNPLRRVSHEKRPLVTSNILEVFERLWGSTSWGVKLSHILRNVILLLLDQRQPNLADILKVLQDKIYREECLENVVSSDVKTFFEKEFSQYTKNDLVPIYNKLGGILSYPSVKRILVTNPNQISLRSIMDGHKILLVNLSKGYLGSDGANILGSLLITSIASSAFSRIDTPEENRPVFFCYIDEFQNYATGSLVGMLSELRKFKLGLIMAHQYLNQLDNKIRDAVLGNVGSIVCFRLSQTDARYMEKEFHPIFTTSDFVNLANYDVYLKLMINGSPSVGFSATTLLPKYFK